MHKLVVIESFKKGLDAVVERMQQDHPDIGKVHVYLLTSKSDKFSGLEGVTVVSCDYSDDQLSAAFDVIGRDAKSVICRGDANVQYLRKVLPYLDPEALVSSAKSLEAATNKRLMREAFTKYFPEITPRFLEVGDASEQTIQEVSSEVEFPVIVKPASLASSLMIQKCDNREQLSSALGATFASIYDVYQKEGRHEQPEVIVEEFLEGDFYSIDSYVLDPDDIQHCPIVAYLPAKSMGIDDFFLYKRWTPVELPDAEIRAAHEATSNAIKALGLQYTSTHTELIRTKNGWKIIELGPRIGRFRNVMYKASYGIDHDYNDLLVHVGKQPNVSIEKQDNSAAYSIYPHRDGRLISLEGVDDIASNIGEIVYLHVSSHEGQEVKQAKNGGHALAEVVFKEADAEEFARQCDWFERNVFAEVQ